jgi:gamma-glutamyltranspeptidase/glutathione hydrolase
MRPALWIVFATTLLATPAWPDSHSAQPEETTAIAVNTSVTAHEFIVATANPIASEVAADILRAGGSAADAAIALQMALNLVEPQSSGIGGGAFALYWNAATGELTSFDGRETAPLSATPAYWLDDQGEKLPFWDAVVGGRSVGVPGTLKLMETLHRKYGRLPWSDLFQPAIMMSEDGFEISARLADSIVSGQEKGLDRFKPIARYLFDESGQPKPAGETLKNPDFARTLRLIAAQGSQPFYTGSIARDIVAAVRTDENTGMLTLQDLAEYKVIERAPVCTGYRGRDICGMGPPSSGALTVGQMLGMLASFDLPGLGDGVESRHLFIEVAKLAYADRALYMADSDFVDMPVKGLLDKDYLAARAALIDRGSAMEKGSAGEPPWDEARLYAPDSPRQRHGTTHFVIVDRYGDMISITSTIETGFGSRVMTNGFILNNELTDFSFVPEKDGKPVANRVEGGKRPRSSMAPTIVMSDGAPVLLVGSPGGSRIINYVAEALIGILDFGLDPQVAIDRPHVVNRNTGTQVEEGPEAEEMIAELAALGNEAKAGNLNSGLQVIQIKDGMFVGAADKRREGLVIGD